MLDYLLIPVYLLHKSLVNIVSVMFIQSASVAHLEMEWHKSLVNIVGVMFIQSASLAHLEWSGQGQELVDVGAEVAVRISTRSGGCASTISRFFIQQRSAFPSGASHYWLCLLLQQKSSSWYGGCGYCH